MAIYSLASAVRPTPDEGSPTVAAKASWTCVVYQAASSERYALPYGRYVYIENAALIVRDYDAAIRFLALLTVMWVMRRPVLVDVRGAVEGGSGRRRA